MKILPVRRAVVGLSLGALAGVGLVGVPTPVHAAVDDAGIGAWRFLQSNCAGNDLPDEEMVPWSDNGVPVSKSTSQSATYGDGGDSVDVATSTNASITASPLGAGPATLTGTATATASVRPSGPDAACEAMVQTMAVANGTFTLTQPTWVTVTVTGQGQPVGDAFGLNVVGIGRADFFGGQWQELFLAGLFLGGDGLTVSAGNRGAATSTTLLPPGKYGVAFGSAASASTFPFLGPQSESGGHTSSASYSGSFKVSFETAGTATPVTGKGASKVQFGERDCASGNVPVNLSKKTVKKAKRVAIRVNGAAGPVLKGKSLKGKHPKARTIMVPTSVTGVTKVKVKFTLENGRRAQATRSYLPCK